MKEHRFPHQVGEVEALAKIEPELDNLACKYGLKLDRVGGKQFRLTRAGVDVLATVADSEIVVKFDLNYFVRIAVGDKIEIALKEELPPLLKA